MLLPVVLMLSKALVDIIVDDPTQHAQRVFDIVRSPLIALLAAVIVVMSPSAARPASPRTASRRPSNSSRPHRGHPADRGRGRRLQADPDRLRVGQMILDISKDWSISALLLPG